MLSHGSLFSGVGGFDEGFRAAGIPTLFCVEKEPTCRAVLRRHNPDAVILDDVCAAGAHNLPRVDILSFGSPCQDLSVAGKRAGLAGERSGLFHEAVRIIRELRPTWAVWENVPGALSSSGGRDFGAVLDALADAGALDLCWRVLDARWFGVPQRRRRLFLVADFGGERAAEILFEREGVCGDYPAGEGSRQGTAADAQAGAHVRCWGMTTYETPKFAADQALTLTVPSSSGGGQPPAAVYATRETAPALTRNYGKQPDNSDTALGPMLVIGPSAVSLRGRDGGGTAELSEGIMPALRASQGGGDKPHVLTPAVLRNGGRDCDERPGRTGISLSDECFALQSEQHHALLIPAVTSKWAKGTGGPAGDECQNLVLAPVCFQQNQRDEVRDMGEATGVVASEPGMHNQNFLALYENHGQDSRIKEVQASPALSQKAGTGGNNLPLVLAVQEDNQNGVCERETSGSLRADAPGHQPCGTLLRAGMTVRRLTPRECERLMGWSDDHTAWGVAEDGSKITMSDSTRYRMCGNGVVGTVSGWIARRILTVQREAAIENP